MSAQPTEGTTPRPWKWSVGGAIATASRDTVADWNGTPADAALIVAAVNDYERLLAVEAARGALRPADIDLFAQRIEANRQRPSVAGYEALVADLLTALRAALARPAEEERG